MRRTPTLPLFLSLLLVPLLLGGCGALLRTEYVRPETAARQQWAAETALENSAASANAASWPEGFGDAELARLVQLALERNNDLAAAALRVRQAQIKAGLAFDDLLPDLSATGGTSSKKSTRSGDWSMEYSAEAGISYEADLWGRLASARDAAEWEAMATEQDRASAELTVVSTTMQLYWQIAYRNVRMELGERNIESAAQTLELILAQEQYGAASALEVNEARQNLASLRAEQQDLIQSRQEDVNALAVLFDMPPGTVMTDPGELAATLPDIPAGLPAELLGRRPDLRAAELRLRELLAETDAARAGFYPTLSLTGTYGGSSEVLATLFENPLLTAASSIALPFLNWNNLHLNLQEKQAEYDEAVVNFRQTLYEAMEEVENALSKRLVLAAKAGRLEESLEAAREVERIYEVRYRAGSGTLKDWLDAQDTRRTAEQSRAENLYDRLTNYVTLYEALGGAPAAPGSAGPDEAAAPTAAAPE